MSDRFPHIDEKDIEEERREVAAARFEHEPENHGVSLQRAVEVLESLASRLSAEK